MKAVLKYKSDKRQRSESAEWKNARVRLLKVADASGPAREAEAEV